MGKAAATPKPKNKRAPKASPKLKPKAKAPRKSATPKAKSKPTAAKAKGAPRKPKGAAKPTKAAQAKVKAEQPEQPEQVSEAAPAKEVKMEMETETDDESKKMAVVAVAVGPSVPTKQSRLDALLARQVVKPLPVTDPTEAETLPAANAGAVTTDDEETMLSALEAQLGAKEVKGGCDGNGDGEDIAEAQMAQVAMIRKHPLFQQYMTFLVAEGADPDDYVFGHEEGDVEEDLKHWNEWLAKQPQFKVEKDSGQGQGSGSGPTEAQKAEVAAILKHPLFKQYMRFLVQEGGVDPHYVFGDDDLGEDLAHWHGWLAEQGAGAKAAISEEGGEEEELEVDAANNVPAGASGDRSPTSYMAKHAKAWSA